MDLSQVLSEVSYTFHIILFLCIFSHVSCRCQSSEPISLEYSVAEEVESGTQIGNLINDGNFEARCSNNDLNMLRFRYLSKAPSEIQLEMTTGSLFISGRLDREEFCPMETLCVIKLDVAVQPARYFQIIKVVLIIQDLNDNWPEFSVTSVTHELPESANVGTSITLPSAIDLDSPKFGINAYDLVDATDHFMLLVEKKMDKSTDVKLVLKEELDHEVQSDYRIQLVAYDGGDKSGVIDINVVVVDVNDNDPHFVNKTYKVVATENIPKGSTILRVKADDPDQGINGEIKYSFTQRTNNKFGSLFKINEENGDISVVDKIDFESYKVMHLGVVATDGGIGTLPAETTVIVQVTDINDNAPHIHVNTLTGSDTALVLEDSPVGTFVALVTVTDLDSDANGEFDCHLAHTIFNLEKLDASEFQVITKKKLDREKTPYFDIDIVCVDHGTPYQESVKSLRIIIGDTNDSPPKFAQSNYFASILENNQLGAFIIQINATDNDTGLNAEIEYSLPQDKPYFSIDPYKGIVKARKRFDREDQREFQFHVIATDKGSPRLSSTAMVLVTVNDVNDQAPFFMQSGYSFGVFENQPPNVEVGQVGAIDRDDYPGNEFYYSFSTPGEENRGSLHEHDPAGVFTINVKSGVITTMRPLDREARSTYQFVVLATDQGSPPLSSSSSVTIYVADVNDNIPQIEFPTSYNNTVRVPLAADKGFVITRVIARDFDLGQNAKLKYQFTNKSYSNEVNGKFPFLIDSDYGIVTVGRKLTENDLNFHRIIVTVSDRGDVPNTVTTTLVIIVDKFPKIATEIKGLESEKTGEEESFLESNNFVIIVSLAVVSGVVTLLLIIAIILIHRYNTAKHSLQNHGRYNCRKEQMRMFPNISQASDERTLTFNQSSSINGSTFSEVAIRSKKEVSFNLDISKRESDFNHSEVISGAKRPDSRHSLPSTIDQHTLQHPEAQSTDLSLAMTSTSSVPAHHLMTSAINTGGATAKLEVIQEQQEEQRQLELERLMEMLRRGDSASVGSNEEGSVTDSGRGASEEGDLNMLMNTHNSDRLSSGLGKRKLSPDNQIVPSISTNTTPVNDECDAKAAVTTFLPKSLPNVHPRRSPLHTHNIRSNQKQKIINTSTNVDSNNSLHSIDENCNNSNSSIIQEECDERSINDTTDNNICDDSEDHTKNLAFIQSTATFGDSVLSRGSMKENSNTFIPDSSSEHFQGSYLDYLKRKNIGINHSTSGVPHTKNYTSSSTTLNGTESCSGLDYSTRDMTGDNRVDEDSVADDDDSSTSGSYVIDPQQLCNEIDQLFFTAAH